MTLGRAWRSIDGEKARSPENHEEPRDCLSCGQPFSFVIFRRVNRFEGECGREGKTEGKKNAGDEVPGVCDDRNRGGANGSRQAVADLACSEGGEDPWHEGGEVVGVRLVTRLPSRTDGGVFPDPSRVLDVVADGEKSGHLSAPLGISPSRASRGRGRWPRAPCLAERPGSARSIMDLMAPHVIRRVTPGDDDRVEVAGLDVAGGDVGLGGVAVLRGARSRRPWGPSSWTGAAACLAEPINRIPGLRCFGKTSRRARRLACLGRLS